MAIMTVTLISICLSTASFRAIRNMRERRMNRARISVMLKSLDTETVSDALSELVVLLGEREYRPDFR